MKRRRSTKGFTTLDVHLAKEGTRQKFEAVAIKEVLAWQLQQAMKETGFSRKALAEQMHTSRSQMNRVLDPKNGNVTIETLDASGFQGASTYCAPMTIMPSATSAARL